MAAFLFTLIFIHQDQRSFPTTHDIMPMREIVFEVVQEADGGYAAEALGESIFTQADTWADLRENVREAVAAYFFDAAKPDSGRLHLVRDEVLAAG